MEMLIHTHTILQARKGYHGQGGEYQIQIGKKSFLKIFANSLMKDVLIIQTMRN